jgi:DHA1 family bicyclomycin/chloramphenicol resistance-like MFS transporter
MAVGAVCSGLAGIGGDPGLAAATVIAAASILAQVCFWIALRSENLSREDRAAAA